MNGRFESNTDFFNNDFNSSIARNLETNTDRLQSASFLFGANNSNDPIPPSFSTPPVPLSSLPIPEHKQHIFPSASLPILPTPHPYQHYAHNGEYTTQVSTPGDSSNLHAENCDPIEQEYLLAAKREQEAPALPDTTTDLINLEFSYKKEDLVEKVSGIKIEGHTSSSNTPNSSTSSGVKTPNLLPVSVPRLSPDTLPPTSRYVELSHSHETVRNAPAYKEQRPDLSGGQGDSSPPPVNGLLSQPPLQEQDPPLSRPALPSTQHPRTQSNHSSGSTQLRSLLSQQRFPAPTDRFPGSSNSAFSRHPSSSLFPPLPLPPTSQPPLPPPLPPSLPPSLPPPDSQDLEVEQASLNRRTSRSEMVVGASDPEEGTPRSNSALETRFTPVPPPSKPAKKSKRTSKHRVPHVRELSYDTGSDQERQSSGGGGLPRTSSSSALSRTGSRSRNGKPFSVLPQPPHITTEVSLPGHSDPSKRLSPPPSDPNTQRELPCPPDQAPPRYLPQPPRPYPDPNPNLSIPVGAEYPYPPYGYPHMAGWPAPGLAPSEEEGPPGYPQQQQQQQQHYFPTYYPYPYMMYPPYPSGGEGREEQYPPYPYPYYPMMPPMYHYLSHPGSRAGSYAPSMADEELTERGSIYSAGPEEGGNPGPEQWQQQLVMERDPSYLLEQVPSQPVSFELISHAVPEKRCTPLLFDFPHMKGTFSGGGDLILTPHAHSASGVHICTLDQLCRQPWLEGHAGFPGPLNSLSVKSEVVRFAQEHVTAAQREGDTDGALLWEYLSRLCAQNGVLVPSDVVELLSRGGAFSVRSGEGGAGQGAGPGGGQAEEQLRLLVLQRRIKEAVELCIAQRLWTHALLLAQALDEHTRASVQDRFTYSLHASDPLQSYYSAVVGKRPHGVHAAYLREGHSWKQHLAMLVSHRHLPASETSISTLASNLAECGHTDAAHLVRLIQGQPLGGWGDAEAKYSLLGQEGTGAELSSRRLEPKALHKTEVYEYARSLSNSEFCLPGFQPFKLQLARLYAEAGLSARAFSYCEAMFASVEKQPCSYSLAFLSQLRSLADRLHGSLVQLASTPVHQPPVYPRWINLLSSFVEQQRGGAIYVPTPFLPLVTPTPSLLSPYPHDTNTPQERTLPHPTVQLPPIGRTPVPVAGTDPYPAAMSPDDDDATTESYKSAADESILGLEGHNTDEEIQDFDIPSIGSSPLPPGMISGPQSPSESINRSAGSSGREEAGGFIGIMGNIVGRIRSKSNTNRNQMRLPKSDRFYFDADKNKWIDKEGGEEEMAALVAPPKDTDLRLPVDPSLPLPPIQPQQLETQGILSHNPRSRYVDVLNRASLPPTAPAAPLFPTGLDAPFSGTLFFPQLDRAGQGPASDQLSAGGGGRGSPDAVSVTTASISEASKEVRQIMRNTQLISKPHPAGMRY